VSETNISQSSPRTTSQSSPDTLPARGYTVDQLVAYIQRQLGSPVFTVELSKQQLLDIIQDALVLYSQWRPRIRYGAVMLSRGTFAYLQGVDLGTGPAAVFFVQTTPLPQDIFWGNLVGVAPMMMTGMSEYDLFLRWQKMWARVTSVQPDWAYDEIEKILYIHNPIDRWHCGVVAYTAYENVSLLDPFGAVWVKEYAFQKARHAYAEILSKFSGAIPGPVKDLQLDQGKRGEASTKITELETRLFGAQISTPIMID
jgi:hypothetical protein